MTTPDIEGYKPILKALAKNWLMAENDHQVSKEASNVLFEVAKKWFPKLQKAKEDEGITVNTPQFVHLRRDLYNKNVPKVYLEIGYRHRDTGDIIILDKLESTPMSRFPPNVYEKLYEVAYVEVTIIKIIF